MMRIAILIPAALLAISPVAPALANDHAALVAKHAAANGVPESLVNRVIKIESRGNPAVISKGNYGLMQIRLGTAKAMGYGGGAQGLLDADTNMTYAVKYLAAAYRAAGGNADRAVSYYQRGFYYEAKAKGFSPYQTAANNAATPDVVAAAATTTRVSAPVTATTTDASSTGAIVEPPAVRRGSRKTAQPAQPAVGNPLSLLADALTSDNKTKGKHGKQRAQVQPRGGAPAEPIY